ncbi:MAG TPA: hypothetical protein VGC79_20195 [Polyangiaceae bacterium]
MTKRAVHRSRPRASVALCLVLLQLLGALHFTLVPHGFGAGLNGLVHLHRAFAAKPAPGLESAATRPAQNRPTLVAGSPACAPEACPFGFTGPSSRIVPASELCALIWLPVASESVSSARLVVDRSRALLSAPKTSPPHTV